MNCIETLNAAGKICLKKADEMIELKNFEAADALQECANVFFEQAEILMEGYADDYQRTHDLTEIGK